MLDSDTKRRIDSCRDILVGKVPDPKSQVEQITIALIYKFMDDMDAEAEEFGGARKFFAGEFAKYGWPKLMAPNMGGFDVLALYSEAIQKMNENPGVPALFRDIFKNAYLPYRDPETLRSFLKEIDSFTYDHSERLGDAFEYLLSVLGSQGDAGQFRTPRHIIDFMVEVLDPKKDETILDPACGTAGFLISSYKHILKHNSKDYRPQNDSEAYDEKAVSLEDVTLDSPLHYKGDLLTPDDRKRLANNIRGYDISPDMVRLSLVNLYLHGFTDPRIIEYDTLTSEERWNEYTDIILANPPFMSPKGGIKPHKRFSVQATRSEVLFVDYIAEHLTPTGRAAIIVPEGIIFQSGTAYKQLREMLVKNYLVAVISLPAGVFNPYSGVKTSIIILDRRLSQKTDSVLFAKIENDGFGLGAQRRSIGKNDLPAAARNIKAWMDSVRNDVTCSFENYANLYTVEKDRIAENGEWNLSGERYSIIKLVYAGNYPEVELGNLLDVLSGFPFASDAFNEDSGFPLVRIRNIKTNHTDTKYSGEYSNEYLVENGDLLIGMDGEFNATLWNGGSALLNQRVCKLHNFRQCLKEYVFRIIPPLLKTIEEGTYAVTVKHISVKQIKGIKIPLPPLDVQKEIVAEIESYQKIIDGARQVIENYQSRIHVEPDWPVVKFEDAPFQIIDGDRGANYPSKEDFSPSGHCLFLNTKNVRSDGFRFNEDDLEFISEEKDNALRKGRLERGDVLLTTRGTIGNTAFYGDAVRFDHIRINSGMLIFRPDANRLSGRYLFHFFQSENFRAQREAIVSGAAQPQLPIRSLSNALIPLPPLGIQNAVVAEIEKEQHLVNANKELIALFEAKVKATINRVWEEAK